ncbi:hypothetical protein [Allorhizobium taibaishanense]|uniref:Uncharacterized protein n=1 Tax=Allorhizobium taibaishanense TaxID=887144 RepID=A0A1Q9A2T4_9HYPH|nr:hypothetical protein [Allorhizobium taibaishanense]MBB4005889.1 hypothetical protein [Allorhizobium taibaishanense]OLP48925.1 hypothetical protein BJF91_17540 [Allorhizobium taibaishanense]
MREFRLSFPASVIAGKRRLDPHDVVLLKTYSLPQGVSTHEEAMILLVLNGCCPEKCPEWQSYFVDAITTFIVAKCPPENRIDTLKLRWLISTFTTDGQANSPIERWLLQQIIAKITLLRGKGAATPKTSSVTEEWQQKSLALA